MAVWLHGLDERHLEPELMDQPGLDAARLHHALSGLSRLNRWSRSVRILWPAIATYARRGHRHSLRILDLASGAGDVPIGLWLKGRRRGLELTIDGWDLNPESIAFARERAAQRRAEVIFERHDVLQDRIPPRYYDVIISSLFLHHLDERNAVMLLGRMGHATGGVILINDLRRSRAGLGLALAAARLLTTSEVVRQDAPASVRNAFTIEEARALARRAGLEGAVVRRRWPFRFLLEWRRK